MRETFCVILWAGIHPAVPVQAGRCLLEGFAAASPAVSIFWQSYMQALSLSKEVQLVPFVAAQPVPS